MAQIQKHKIGRGIGMSLPCTRVGLNRFSKMDSSWQS